MNLIFFNQEIETPPLTHNENETSKPKKYTFPFLLTAFTVIVLAFAGSKFWERFYNDPSLDKESVEAAQREADEIRERHETWVQYALIADYDGLRPCLRCPMGISMVTVKMGEIYKYGITTQGAARYSQGEYANLGVTYFEEFAGTYLECKELEINKIVAYRFLPQSKKPEVKLVRPPGNANKS